MRIGAIAIALFGIELFAAAEDQDPALIAAAKDQLNQLMLADPDLKNEIGQLMENDKFGELQAALESRYLGFELAERVTEDGVRSGGSWNDTWFEAPRDQIHGLENTFGTGKNLTEWFLSQEWQTFISPVGKPGSRRTRNVHVKYVTVRGDGTKGGIVFCLGLAEPILKYSEVAYDFITKGYSPLYIYTHRGQGESNRLITNPYPAYVESSRDYIHDLRAFTELAASEMASNDVDKEKPLYHICHSLGCGVSVGYLIEEYEAQRQSRYFAVGLVTPSIKPNTGSWDFGTATALVDLLVGIGQGQGYSPGEDKVFLDDHSINLFPNILTNSFTRHKWSKEQCIQYEDVPLGQDQHPGLCNYGLTNRWTKELFDQFKVTSKFMEVEGKKLDIPIKLLTAGNISDGLVMNPFSRQFCQEDATDCSEVNYLGGGHWLLGEVDERRDRVLGDIDTFFASHPDAPVTSASLPPGLKANGEGCNLDRDCFSGFCDANFGWDIFGGKCAISVTFMDGSPTPVLAALSVGVAVVAALAA